MPVQVVRAMDSQELAQRVTQDRVGVELWRMCLVLALAFLGAEMIIGTRGR